MPWYLLGIMVLMKRCVMGLAKIAQFSFSSACELLANPLKFLMCFYLYFFMAYIPNDTADSPQIFVNAFPCF